MDGFFWSWDPSSSPDVVFYVLFVALVNLTGWYACPTEEIPDLMCPIYQATDWILIAETPGLSVIDSTPTPTLGSVVLVDVEAADWADNVSSGEAAR